ncbi:MAG: hypothetical protein AAF376_05195 [Pseudomonadota bacterium]
MADADCPTRDDLERGVQLTRTDPFFSILLQQTPDGLTESRVMERDGSVTQATSIYAHPLVVSERIGDGRRLALVYQEDVDQLERLREINVWQSPVTLFDGGAELASGTVTVGFLDVDQVTIGACTYDVWVVASETWLDIGNPSYFDYYYAPELGLLVGTVRIDDAGQPLHGVFFDEIKAR